MCSSGSARALRCRRSNSSAGRALGQARHPRAGPWSWPASASELSVSAQRQRYAGDVRILRADRHGLPVALCRQRKIGAEALTGRGGLDPVAVHAAGDRAAGVAACLAPGAGNPPALRDDGAAEFEIVARAGAFETELEVGAGAADV